MKKLALILTIILTLCFSLLTTCSLAEETNALEVLLTTDKAEYTSGETIVATLTVTNNYAVDIALIQMENLVPENCELAVASRAKQTVEDLASGETAELVTRFVTPAAVVLPQTGDAAHPMVWAMLAATALAGMIWLFVCRRKAFFCLFAVLMVSALLTSGGLVLARADVQSNVTTVSTTVMVDGMPLVLHAEVIEGAGKNIYKAPDPEHIRDSVDSIGQYVDNQLLLVAEEEVTQEQIEALIASHNGTVVGCLYLTDDFQIEFPTAYTEVQLEEIAAEWMESGLLIRADINAAFEVSATSQSSIFNDPENTEWALEAIRAEGAWQYQDRFTYPVIGIIDKDFDPNHEDLQAPGIYMLKDAGSSTDKDISHGSHVLGIMAAEPDNNKGITGLALFPEVFAYPIRTDVSDLAMYKSTLTALIAGLDCKAINISIGNHLTNVNLSNKKEYKAALKQSKKDGQIFDDFFSELIDEGYDDFLIIQAAGNNGANAELSRLFVCCDKNEDHIMVVGNANKTNLGYRLDASSSYGTRVDVVAPGTGITSATIANTYKSQTGSSMAAPFVTGLASLCYSIDPSLSGPEVKQIIIDTAEYIVEDTVPSSNDEPNYSRDEVEDHMYKMINAQAAVEMAGGIESDINDDDEIIEDEELPDDQFIITARIIDPDTGKPLSKLDGSQTLYFVANDGSSHALGSAQSANPLSDWAKLEDCRDINQFSYIRKNGDWYVTEIDPFANNKIDLGDIVLNKFDSSKPYVSIKKVRNSNGTITFTIKTTGLGTVQFYELIAWDEDMNRILDVGADTDHFTLTNTTASFTISEEKVAQISSGILVPNEEGIYNREVCIFTDDISNCGLGEVRFNTDIPVEWKVFNFHINNPLSENYSN